MLNFKTNKNKKDTEGVKIRREIIFAAAVLILVIFSTFEELRMVYFSNASITSKVIVYAYINITVVLFLLMSFLVLRNVVKLVIERKKGIIGAKLRTKFVGLFVIVSIVPSIFMFIVLIMTGFAANIINKWYSPRFERAMDYAASIAGNSAFSKNNAGISHKIKWLSHFYMEYLQIRFIKNPVETTYLIFFSIFTLIILFVSLWVGFYFSKKLTKPIIDLVEGTKKAASGDFNIKVPKNSDDEIGMLIDSFNVMAMDLKKNKEEIEKTNTDLKKVNEEIDRKGKYMEIILKNIHAGVIGIDATGKIRSLNNAAEEMFGINHKDVSGRNYKDVFDEAVFSDIRSIINILTKENKESLTKEIKFNISGNLKVYIVNLTVLKDEAGNYVGFIIVLNDTTDMMKAQRVAAWEEVAKRMSHEIKNPLTPIRLSAERLKRKFGNKIDADDTIFNDSINMIIKETDDLKNLVDEFSLYARLPKANFEPADLNILIDEAVLLYKGAHKNIEFIERLAEKLPKVFIDKRQMKRAFMNIIDNALFSITLKLLGEHGAGSAAGYKGNITITTRSVSGGNKNENIVRVVFSDNGTGIKGEVMQNMYEPYFSTKQGGTGLGLAITKNIAMENNAVITAKNNKRGGADFIIDLKAESANSFKNNAIKE
ncbi:ATP-binding protein [Candidatus Acidulodesulfobacterium sp. H_13]|uniref:ATP-binding protein n=1 Tax=Candidatus Acidulodesulfobacterium sp. H_13 TaxID=3395470 RepID=UPI003AF9AB19